MVLVKLWLDKFINPCNPANMDAKVEHLLITVSKLLLRKMNSTCPPNMKEEKFLPCCSFVQCFERAFWQKLYLCSHAGPLLLQANGWWGHSAQIKFDLTWPDLLSKLFQTLGCSGNQSEFSFTFWERLPFNKLMSVFYASVLL